MQGPLVIAQRSETVQGKVDTFSETDSRVADKQQRIGVQIVGTPEFLL